MSTLEKPFIDPNRLYYTTEVADFINLSSKQVSRLVDLGEFPGSERRSTLSRSPRMIPGSAIIAYLERKSKL